MGSVQVATEAAELHVQAFYRSLGNDRARISSFYSPQTAPSATSPTPLPQITYNGHGFSDGDALQKFFQDEMPPTRYDAHSFDCQVLHPASVTKGNEGMSLLLNVSGTVKVGEASKGFSETFVLVPNPALANRRARRSTGGTKEREWLIQTQFGRFVT